MASDRSARLIPSTESLIFVFDLEHVLSCPNRAKVAWQYQSEGKFLIRQEAQLLVLPDQATVIAPEGDRQCNLITEDVAAATPAGPSCIATHDAVISAIAANDDCSVMIVGENSGSVTQYERLSGSWRPSRCFGDLEIDTIFSAVVFGDLAVLGGVERFCVINTRQGLLRTRVSTLIGNVLSLQVYRADDSTVYLAMSGYSFGEESGSFDLRNLAAMTDQLGSGSLQENRRPHGRVEPESSRTGSSADPQRLQRLIQELEDANRQLEDTNRQLRSRVSRLEARCAALEKQIQESHLGSQRINQSLANTRIHLEHMRRGQDCLLEKTSGQNSQPRESEQSLFLRIEPEQMLDGLHNQGITELRVRKLVSKHKNSLQSTRVEFEEPSISGGRRLPSQCNLSGRERKLERKMQNVRSKMEKYKNKADSETGSDSG